MKIMIDDVELRACKRGQVGIGWKWILLLFLYC